ncbi:acyltransferase family protein [Cellulomonas edaphi]|uniref:Acyltransferase family protein n=1 Tax=Cellulomonas edaphi TaxID=3053468 RepID=A0ABT7S896_9CELL|nr:acyltransferase family protein [Cellulomons edaphi]MDM7831836.1 acyltransferase family protein [Cellulomons edaphi]
MTTSPTALAPAPTPLARGDRPAPRRDIQVLRALAVALVVVYHLWPQSLRGGYIGVDVFFVISGFLITSHLLKHPPARPRDLAHFWARRVRRLLPAASLVLLVTVVASAALLPSGLLMRAAHEAVRATFYVENWSLADQATDYLAADSSPTPVQHFWSLAVEEQFYLVWPVGIGVVALVGLWLRRSRAVVAVGVAAVLVTSLVYGIRLTGDDPARAYFVTGTRMWELALGGLVAALVVRRRQPAALRAVVAWGGLMAVLVAAFWFSAGTPFPGWAALLPTVGAAAVIWADADDAYAGPTSLLGGRPVVALGDISYSVYLWHWPLVVLLPFALGAVLTWPTRLAVLAASLLLAWVTKVLVEDRFRTDRRLTGSLPRTFLVGAVCMALTAGAATAAGAWGSDRLDRERATFAAVQATAPDCFGAEAARDRSCDLVGDRLFTSPTVAATDTPDVYRDLCWNNAPFTTRHVCEFGSSTPGKRIALLGNSHAGHWLPALQGQLDREGWQLSTYLASVCYTVDIPVEIHNDAANDGCVAWNTWAVDAVISSAPDLVIMSDRTFQPLVGVSDDDKVATAAQAYARVLSRFTDAGIAVLVLRDTPAAAESAPDCVARERSRYAQCAAPADVAIEPDPLADVAAQDTTGLVDVLDINHLICVDGMCRDVVGGVVVLFDWGHLTATFARTLRPEVEAAVAARIG